MIQKVIYRRKAESLAPGRGLLLNYILWGWRYEGAAAGEASLPYPSRSCPCGSCCWRGIPCSQWETRTGSKERVPERGGWRKREESHLRDSCREVWDAEGLGSGTASGRSLGLLSAPGQLNIANPPEQRASRIFLRRNPMLPSRVILRPLLGSSFTLTPFLLLDSQWVVGWEAGDLALYSEVETHFFAIRQPGTWHSGCLRSRRFSRPGQPCVGGRNFPILTLN